MIYIISCICADGVALVEFFYVNYLFAFADLRSLFGFSAAQHLPKVINIFAYLL
jgi:hypothetical protein